MGEIRSIKRVSISELKPYENNAKRHGKRQIERLAASIKEFGFVSPILIDKNNVIIAGHGRFEAATSLGMEKVTKSSVRWRIWATVQEQRWHLIGRVQDRGTLSTSCRPVDVQGISMVRRVPRFQRLTCSTLFQQVEAVAYS